MATNIRVQPGTASWSRQTLRYPLLLAVALLAAVGWAYWSSLSALVRIWTRDPQYSHGYLVPAFSLALLWMRRDQLERVKLESSAWAIPFVVIAALLRVLSARYDLTWFDHLSLLPALAAVSLAVGGWPLLRWTGPAVAFLFFMIPLPGRLQGMMGLPLQRIASAASTHALQTFGFPAQADGTVILLAEEQLDVVEACSGIRMLLVFFALSTGVAMLAQRAWYQRVFLVLSAVPIALLCNIIRITVTGILYETVGSQTAQYVYHDLAGWLMIPMALGFLGLELWFLSRLFVATEPVLVKR